MTNLTVLGIDIAMNVFQLHGTDHTGKVVMKKRLSRSKFIHLLPQLPQCIIGLEACGTAHHWGRVLSALGHQVKLMPPAYVKIYVKRNKNDAVDAEACNEAVTRPNMHFVPIKSEEQQAVLMLHKVRAVAVKQRTQLCNQMRSYLAEFGIVAPKGKLPLIRSIAGYLEDADNQLPILARHLLVSLYEQYKVLDEQIKQYEKRIEQHAAQDPMGRLLQDIPGVGPIIASASVATLQGYDFKLGRQAAAWMGITPRQEASGETNRLFGISKRGDRYLRTLFIHGARNIVRHCGNKQDKESLWLKEKIETRGYNKAVVAMANKNVRRVYAILKSGTPFKANFSDDYVWKKAA